VGLKSFLLGVLFLSACRVVEPRITEARMEGKEPGEVLVRFRLDCDVRNLGNSHSLGYIQLPGPLPPNQAAWHAVADLQEVPGGRRAEMVEYLCQFPLKADQPGTYYYIGADGKRASLWVEHPYDLSDPGEHALEFRVLGGGCGFFVTGVASDAVTLTYRRP
jgi:hypothetical protein